MCGGRNGSDFGCPKCAESIFERKHGWVECKSTSFPGNVYYFHTKTGCSTWQRPVPRNTPLPRYKKWRDSRCFDPPMDDETLPSELGLSETQGSFFGFGAEPSDFELHTRRMQIYLENDTDNCPGINHGRSESLRDKLIEFYRNAKFVERAKRLELQKTTLKKKKTVLLPSVKPTTKSMKPVKTIRECHGIKTISYDPLPRQLPIGTIEMPDLSETSVETLTPANTDLKLSHNRIQSNQKAIAEREQNFGRFVFNDLNLSESETTASCVLESV